MKKRFACSVLILYLIPIVHASEPPIRRSSDIFIPRRNSSEGSAKKSRPDSSLSYASTKHKKEKNELDALRDQLDGISRSPEGRSLLSRGSKK